MEIGSSGSGAGLALATELVKQTIQQSQVGAAAQALAQEVNPGPTGPQPVAETSGGNSNAKADDHGGGGHEGGGPGGGTSGEHTPNSIDITI